MIVAGFGFRGQASLTSLLSAMENTGRVDAADALATLEAKASGDTFRRLAEHLSLPVVAVTAQRLAQQPTATRSAAAMTAHGTGSVAEAAALAAAGPNARLLAPRAISDDRQATCALAQGDPT